MAAGNLPRGLYMKSGDEIGRQMKGADRKLMTGPDRRYRLRSRRRRMVWGVAAAVWLCQGARLLAKESWSPVLVLASGHSQSSLEAEQIAGMRSVLPPDTELLIEYLEAKQINRREHFFQFYETLMYGKYKNRGLAVIVALNDDAIRFLNYYRTNVFFRPPAVVCGSRESLMEEMPAWTNWTGVFSEPDVGATIHQALKLHPDAKRVHVLADRTPLGRWARGQIHHLPPAERIPVPVRFSKRNTIWSYLHLFERVRGFEPDSIVFYAEYYTDEQGKIYLPRHLVPRISKESKAPLYTMRNEAIGAGAVGGHVLYGTRMGVEAGKMVQRILAGESVGNIPPVTIEGEWRFDDAQLKRWGIRDSELPAGSRILNRPVSFYEKNKLILWVGGLIVVLESCIIAMLLINRAGRIRAQRALQTSEIRYRSLFESTQDMLAVLDGQGGIVQVNPEMGRRLGYDEKVLRNMEWTRLLPPEDRARVRALWTHARSRGSDLLETHYLPRDGEPIPVEILWQPYVRDGVAGRLCIGRDLSERVKMQRLAWDMREQEQVRIGQELHDGLCQELKSIECGLVNCENQLLHRGGLQVGVLHKLQERSNGAVKNAYRIARNLLPLGPKADCFPDALRLLVEEMFAGKDLKTELQIRAECEPGGRETALHIYRIAQEALQNVLSHAKAESIQIRWTCMAEGQYILVVRDDGCGLGAGGESPEGGLGLFIMRSRAQLIGAGLSIRQPAGGGTEVRCAHPAREADHEPA